MSTLSIAELQAQVETALDNTTLQQIIDAVELEIQSYAGPAAGKIWEVEPGIVTTLQLPTSAASITSVTEFTDARSEPTETALSSDDYELSSNGWDLRRLSDGTNPRDVWGWRVAITYTPTTQTALRKQVAIQLARLDIAHSAYASENMADASASSKDIRREKANILRRMPRSGIV